MLRSGRFREYGGWLLLLLVSLYFVIQGTSYGLGTMQRMQAGTFPVLVGACLAIICVLMLLRVPPEDEEARWDVRPLAAVMAALVAFGLLVRTAGLVPAIWAAMAVAALGDPNVRWIRLAAVMAGVALAAWLLFTVMLRLPLPAFRGF